MKRIVHLLPSVPVMLLAACLLAFGAQIPWLGYYLDDWIILQSYQSGGLYGLMEYTFWGNRPLVFWLWAAGFQVAGSDPLIWQVWALFWRWTAACVFWLILRRVWPERRFEAGAAALLFCVYPLFLQQPVALTYSFHWICFTLFGLSIWLNQRSLRRAGSYLPNAAGAALLDAIQLFSQEFFAGLELVRLLVLWAALPGELRGRKRAGRALLAWLPHLVLLAGFGAWRLRWMPTPGFDRNTPDLVSGLLASPLASLARLAQMALQDMAQALAGVWSTAFNPGGLAFQPVSNWLALGLGLAAAGIAWWTFRRLPADPSLRWCAAAFAAGLAAMAFGFAPGWAIGSPLYGVATLFNDRFGLAAMPGAALAVTAGVAACLRSPRFRLAAVCMMTLAAVALHARTLTQYRYSWEKQNRFYWQLAWRAPQISTPVAILGNGALFGYMGSWANISAINQLYDRANPSSKLNTWYVDLYKARLDELLEPGARISDRRIQLVYNAPANRALVLQYEPENLSCLWLLAPDDLHNPYLDPAVKAALPLSDPGLILPEGKSPDPVVFGREPEHGWCYTFQKAGLALQQNDPRAALALWDEAEASGQRPRIEVEYVPFIQAAAKSGDWERAVEWTQKAYFPTYVMHDYLCVTWRELRDELPASPDLSAALDQVNARLDCRAIIR